MNGMIYVRGHASDYERWAKDTGDRGWGWDKVLAVYVTANWHLLRCFDALLKASNAPRALESAGEAHSEARARRGMSNEL